MFTLFIALVGAGENDIDAKNAGMEKKMQTKMKMRMRITYLQLCFTNLKIVAIVLAMAIECITV